MQEISHFSQDSPALQHQQVTGGRSLCSWLGLFGVEFPRGSAGRWAGGSGLSSNNRRLLFLLNFHAQKFLHLLYVLRTISNILKLKKKIFTSFTGYHVHGISGAVLPAVDLLYPSV